ncbi:hypothetical protein RK21_02432 [Pseudomonas plecoglossicida]|nr:hypothetical protein RK21_02432 [Pseudomonas plecoglossicida]
MQIHTSPYPKYLPVVKPGDTRHCSGQVLMVSLRDKNNARVFISALAM